MIFIDTHSHLYLEEFDNDLSEVIERAKQADIQRVLLPNIDSSTVERLLKTTENHADFFFPMMGLHPTSVKENYKNELENVEKELKTGKYIAIGEIGIDLYWDKNFAKEQNDALRIQFDMALKFDLPVAIHMRDSFDEIISVAEDYRGSGLRGVFHCFTGNLEQAHQIINLGYYLGIGGVVTFKNSGLDKVVKELNLQHLILETDAPYLSPVPFRGKRNESAYMIRTAEKLASIFEKPLDDIANITTTNAKQLFRI